MSAEVKLSDPGILRAVLAKAGFNKAEQLAAYDRVLDGDDTALDEAQARLPRSTASLKSLLSIEGEGVPYLNNLRSALLPVIPEIASPLDELTTVSSVLAQVGVSHRIAPVLVRNFEYYTGPVFYLYVDGRKLGGGGRYDALVSLVGGGAAPAAGFAIDMQVISSLLPSIVLDSSRTVSIRIAGEGDGDLGAAFLLARTLRDSGIRVELVAGTTEQWPLEIAASAGGFVLTADGAEPRRLAGADDVVRALAEFSRD